MVSKPAEPDRFVFLPIDMEAVAKAAVAFLSDPIIGERQVGAAFVLDLAATVAADPDASALLARSDVDDAEKRLTLRTVIFHELLRRRFRYQ